MRHQVGGLGTLMQHRCKMTEKDLKEACAVVLGHDVVEAMLIASIYLPQILNIAAVKAFQESWDDAWRNAVWEHLDCLRSALNMMESPGYFTFEEEKEENGN